MHPVLRLLAFFVVTLHAVRSQTSEYRLPSNVVPNTYTITLTPNFDDYTFAGHVEINIRVIESVNTFTLHINQITIPEGGIVISDSTPGSMVTNYYTGHTINETLNFLTISTNPTLVADTIYTLAIDYQGILNNNMNGFYRSEYQNGDQTIVLGATQFEPTYARQAFPCWDEPSFKAAFQIIIRRPRTYHAVANTPLLSSVTYDTNLDEDTFDWTPTMSTYLVAFIVSDFVHITNGLDQGYGVLVRENALEQATFAYDTGPKVLTTMEQFTGISYYERMGKLDQSAIPDFSAGAMENWGLVTFRESGLLYDPHEGTTMNKQLAACIIGHEFSHMWFGDLVTMDWWSHLWLNEGFARYFEYHLTAMVSDFSSWELEKQFVIEQVQSVFRVDALLTTTSLSSEASTPTEISAKFGSISYAKGNKETALLYDPHEDTARNQQRVATVISHEFSHLWFGDLVTLAWWSDIWLNEGFATYFEYHVPANITDFADWGLTSQFVLEQLQDAFTIDALVSAVPLSAPADNPTQISARFDTISYNKGGSVIRMLEHFIGHTNFQNGLQRYLNQLAESNTTPELLLAALQTEIGDTYNLTAVMENWIRNPGYPLIYVARATDGSSNIVLNQRRFFLDISQVSDQTWQIPISYTTRATADFSDTSSKVFLTDENDLVVENVLTSAENDWVILNVQQTGYYRVNYSSELWESIQSQLSTDPLVIHEINRAQIVDDVLSLARVGHVDYDTALNVVSYLRNESSYYPWYSAFTNFAFVRNRIGTNTTTFQFFVSYLVTPLYTRLGFDETETESHLDTLNKVQVLTWACNSGVQSCIDRSRSLYASWRDGTIQTVPPNLRSIVYCNALRYGTVDDWNFLWNAYGQTDLASVRVIILQALGCTRDVDTLNRYLQLSIDPTSGIRSQDAMYAFSSVYSNNDVGIDVAFQFLQTNYLDISARYGGLNALGNAVSGLSDRFTTQDQVDQLQDFLDAHATDLADVAVTYQSSIENAQQNLRWTDTFSGEVTSWLLRYQDLHYSGTEMTKSNTLIVLLMVLLSLVYLM